MGLSPTGHPPSISEQDKETVEFGGSQDLLSDPTASFSSIKSPSAESFEIHSSTVTSRSSGSSAMPSEGERAYSSLDSVPMSVRDESPEPGNVRTAVGVLLLGKCLSRVVCHAYFEEADLFLRTYQANSSPMRIVLSSLLPRAG